MQYKGNRVFTTDDFMKVIGVKSWCGMKCFCKRNGVTPMKLSRDESLSFCNENGFYKNYPNGLLLFTVSDMDKALHVQGISKSLTQANPDGSVKAFSCSEFQQLRVIEDANGNPWFVGKDVAENLWYEYMANAIRDHVYFDDKALLKKKDGMGIVVLNENGSKVRESRTLGNPFPSPINITGLNVPPRGLTIINESGMYSLIFGSKLESARRLKYWGTSEVLPSIRRTGGYSMKESGDSASNTVDEKLDEIVKQIQIIKAYLVTRDTAHVLVSREMMKK